MADEESNLPRLPDRQGVRVGFWQMGNIGRLLERRIVFIVHFEDDLMKSFVVVAGGAVVEILADFAGHSALLAHSNFAERFWRKEQLNAVEVCPAIPVVVAGVFYYSDSCSFQNGCQIRVVTLVFGPEAANVSVQLGR